MISAQQLRMARAALGWTLSDLAKKAGVNPNTLSRYEAGRDVLASVLRKVEKALQVAGVTFTEDDDSVTVRAPTPDRQKNSRP